MSYLIGYGQTECVAAVTLTVQGDFRTDHVGPPIACCCLKVSISTSFVYVD